MNLNNNPNQAPPPVYNHQVRPRIAGKSKFLTFLFALIPGAGQMFHGLMKKGTSLMLLFWGTIALSMALYFPVFMFVTPIVWFYSFFDTINRMNFSLDELAAVEDKFILDFKIENNGKINELLRNRHIFIGWSAIFLGIYSFVAVLINSDFFYRSGIPSQIYHFIRTTVPSMLIPIICILIGSKLIIGSKKKTEINLIQEETKND